MADPDNEQETNLLARAERIAAKKHGFKGGMSILARACGVSYKSFQSWKVAGRLPLACLSELQTYHHSIAEAIDNEITSDELIAWSRLSWEKYYENR